VDGTTIRKIEGGETANAGFFIVAAIAHALKLDLTTLARRPHRPV